MDQGELTGIYCARPQNFSLFLGAGSSRTAGLPTASDIIWDLKRRYYCREENQEISRRDIHNASVKTSIQEYMESVGFPAQWADNEYPAYFEKIFGENKERQRKYVRAILSEDKVTLSVGSRVVGALIASKLCRVAFTTNFDSVVEKAVAEVGGQSLSAYHLEGSGAAKEALDNEEYPIYCKLHGDFRYDSLKNLPHDLLEQDKALSECLVNAGNRFGFIVIGYSGRDRSIIDLFHSVLDSSNPFPHGLFWTGIKGSDVHPAVSQLLNQARQKGVHAEYVPIETFDALLLRLWRNIDPKPPHLDAQIRKTRSALVSIPLPPGGRGKPLMRLNALSVLAIPKQCLKLSFSNQKEWGDLHQTRNDTKGQLIFTKSDSIWCWGAQSLLQETFKTELLSVQTYDLPTELDSSNNLHFKGFVEEALCTALARAKPLLCRTTRSSAFLIADPYADDKTALQPLTEVIGSTTGTIPKLFTTVTEHQPYSQPVMWSEAVRVSLNIKDKRMWLLIDPDIWIWPPRARKSAISFMDRRRGDRYNKKYNSLLDAWVRVILGTNERNTEVAFSAFSGGDAAENPSFKIGSRTAFSRRLLK